MLNTSIDGKRFNFQKFSSNSTNTTTDFITLTKSKTVNLSKDFIDKNNLNKKFVVFFYDSEKKAFALRFSVNRANDSFTVSYDKRGNGATISCSQVLKTFNINPEQYSGRYNYKSIDTKEGKIFVFELKDKKNA